MKGTLAGSGALSRLLKSRSLPLLFFAALFLVMLAFSCMTPLVADDFSYKFSWADVSRIKSLGQIIPSMAAHRVLTNGRVLAHGTVQLLLMLPKLVFNLLNALNACLLGALFLRHFRSSPARSALLLLCGAFLIWNFMPAFGQVFLWLDGAVNYSWGISLFLLFLWPYAAAYLGEDSRRPFWRNLLFLLLAFAAGSYSENGSIAAIFAAVCLTGLTALRERRPRRLSLAGIAAACLGFLFLLSAPAMRTRAAVFSVSALAVNIRDILITTREQAVILYGIYAVLLALCLLSGADRRKLVLSAVYVLAGLGSLSAFIFASYFTERHLCFTLMFTVLACLLLLSALLEQGKKALPTALTALLAVAFVFNFLLGALDIAVIFGKSLERERIIRAALAAGEPEVALEMYLPSTKYSAAYGLQDLNADRDQWPNDSVALYYGLAYVIGFEPGE